MSDVVATCAYRTGIAVLSTARSDCEFRAPAIVREHVLADIDPHPLSAFLRKLEYSGPLSREDRLAVLDLPHRLRVLEQNAFIAREGEEMAHVCLLREGFVIRHKFVGNGGRQICSIHMKGDVVDLQNAILERADHNVEALTTAEVAFIPKEAIRALALARPAVGVALWFDTLVDASIFREWIANVGRRNARGRLAHLLCEFSLRLEAAGLGKHDDYTLPMSQEQLADCTGMTSVHVNRTLRSLDQHGVIARTSRSVRVNDWKALAEIGDFRAGYLHMRPDQLAITLG